MWELNGFGDPIYVNVGYAWRGHFANNPPEVPLKDNHVGTSFRGQVRRSGRSPDPPDKYRRSNETSAAR